MEAINQSWQRKGRCRWKFDRLLSTFCSSSRIWVAPRISSCDQLQSGQNSNSCAILESVPLWQGSSRRDLWIYDSQKLSTPMITHLREVMMGMWQKNPPFEFRQEKKAAFLQCEYRISENCASYATTTSLAQIRRMNAQSLLAFQSKSR